MLCASPRKEKAIHLNHHASKKQKLDKSCTGSQASCFHCGFASSRYIVYSCTNLNTSVHDSQSLAERIFLMAYVLLYYSHIWKSMKIDSLFPWSNKRTNLVQDTETFHKLIHANWSLFLIVYPSRPVKPSPNTTQWNHEQILYRLNMQISTPTPPHVNESPLTIYGYFMGFFMGKLWDSLFCKKNPVTWLYKVEGEGGPGLMNGQGVSTWYTGITVNLFQIYEITIPSLFGEFTKVIYYRLWFEFPPFYARCFAMLFTTFWTQVTER